MGMNCGCPAGPHLEDLSIAQCKESLGQVQKVIIQRIFKTSGVKNKMTLENIKTKSSMTANFSAADGTKMIITPFIQGPDTTPGAARVFGGGNQTLGGVEIVIGREPTAFTAMIYQEAQSTIKTMKSYQCENIGVLLIDENGNIAGDNQGGTTEIAPLPIQKFFVGDKKLGGLEEPDSNEISWNFVPNWSDNLVIVKRSELDYDPLSDLVNVASV